VWAAFRDVRRTLRPMHDQTGTSGDSDRYRKLASDIRALVPNLRDPDVIEELRVVAACYDSLAQHLETLADLAIGANPSSNGRE
jgi:hypothetical protein